jgi:hypothetical protein
MATVGSVRHTVSHSDVMTIARHFNAGLNPQNIPSPAATTDGMNFVLTPALTFYPLP